MNITTRKPFTPGEILYEEFMQPHGLTQAKVAELAGITRRRVNEIIRGRRSITPDTALRLGRLFNMTPDFWLNLQVKMDLWVAMNTKEVKKSIHGIKPLLRGSQKDYTIV